MAPNAVTMLIIGKILLSAPSSDILRHTYTSHVVVRKIVRSILITLIIHILFTTSSTILPDMPIPIISTSINSKSKMMIWSNSLALLALPTLNRLLISTTITSTIGNILIVIFSIQDMPTSNQ